MKVFNEERLASIMDPGQSGSIMKLRQLYVVLNLLIRNREGGCEDCDDDIIHLAESIVSEMEAIELYDNIKNPDNPDNLDNLKLLCPSCGYLVKTSQKWLDIGTPTCVCGTQMEVV